MENDRELMEWAAKAAGLNVQCMALSGFNIMSGDNAGNIWNPLTDDGDALRLAVKLGITVEQWLYAGHVYAGFPGSALADERHKRDKYAATRRAIVRAAAEIGKRMNGT